MERRAELCQTGWEKLACSAGWSFGCVVSCPVLWGIFGRYSTVTVGEVTFRLKKKEVVTHEEGFLKRNPLLMTLKQPKKCGNHLKRGKWSLEAICIVLHWSKIWLKLWKPLWVYIVLIVKTKKKKLTMWSNIITKSHCYPQKRKSFSNEKL